MKATNWLCTEIFTSIFNTTGSEDSTVC